MNHRGSPLALLLTSNLLIGLDLWPQRSEGRKWWPSGQILVRAWVLRMCWWRTLKATRVFERANTLKWVSVRSRSSPRVGTPVCSWQLVNRGRCDRQPQSPTAPPNHPQPLSLQQQGQTQTLRREVWYRQACVGANFSLQHHPSAQIMFTYLTRWESVWKTNLYTSHNYIPVLLFLAQHWTAVQKNHFNVTFNF